jgi:hypothetical protein
VQLRGPLAKQRRSFKELASEFWSLCDELRPVYAYACAVDEFDAKNMDHTNGVQAIGNDISKSFPGLYWRNFFRSDLVRRLWNITPALPDCAKVINVDGFGFSLGEDPYAWSIRDRIRCESEIRERLGKELFFDRASRVTTGAPVMEAFVSSKCESLTH